MSSDSKQELELWIKQLSENDMPAFSNTVSGVTSEMNNDKSSAVDVAQMVLKDASLTARLIKTANSAFFNPSKQPINTVSRAIMILGFDQVRTLTLSLMLVDNLGNGAHPEKVVEEMAHAFHSAIQAQELAKQVVRKQVEDIFVATLLSNIGNMAFWAFSDDEAQNLIEKMEDTDDPEETEKEVLGFTLKDLTKGLSKTWSLGELLDDYLHDRLIDKRVSFIKYGKKLAEAVASGSTLEAIDEIADELNIDVEELEQLVFENAKKAKEVTKLYGSYEVSRKIPQPVLGVTEQSEQVDELESELDAIEAFEDFAENEEPLIQQYPEPDAAYQMSVMQEITDTVQERPSIGIILEMVLEGIHRGVGMDRAMFAILNPEKTHLSCKYALGDQNEKLRKEFEIDIRRPENVFHKIVQHRRPTIVPGDPKQLDGTISKNTLSMIGTPPYIVMPTIVKNKVIGVFMADRNASGREITEQEFLAFQQFCQQANMGLSFLATRG